MKFRAKKVTELLDAPAGSRRAIISRNQEVTGTGNSSGEFIEVDVGDGQPGWARKADFDQIGGEGGVALDPIDVGNFVAECITAERAINNLATTSPWFVYADFILARGLIETDLTNVGPKIAGSDGTGPLQVSSAEWGAFLKDGGEIAKGFRPADFDEPLMQINGAAFRMHADAKAISNIKKAKGVGTDQDPFTPSMLDVFHAYITNSAEAAVAILDAEKSDADKAKKVSEVLSGPLKPEQIDALFKARGQFVGTSAVPKTVAEFVAATEAALNDALKKAFDLITTHAHEELPQLNQGEAPWFDIALQAEKAQIDEKDPADKDTILDYFKSTDLGRPDKIVAWCGAFAAHCMKTSGNPAAAASVPKSAAVAASWNGWGDSVSLQSKNIPVGAVVVLSPSEGTGTSGHVGFFVQFLDGGKKVELLGGNQGDKVQRTPFLASRVVHVGWLDVAGSSEPVLGELSDTAISPEAITLIVSNEVTSQAVYEKRYRAPIWPKGASGVTIGIGYDVGYSTPTRLKDDWNGLLTPGMISKLQTACGVTGSAASSLAKKLASEGVDVSFNAAMSVFLKRDIPRWVGIVERALPNTKDLNKNQLGALVSLAYNRGASFSKSGDRYREMNNIKTHMTSKNFAKIPDEFLSMRRLWPSLPGLVRRRKEEAELFAKPVSAGG